MIVSDDLRYPIGRFSLPVGRATAGQRDECIGQIDTLPRRLHDAVTGLTAPQLATPYRPGGWTVRQLVHHIADSHLNAYARFKLALTEDEPTIKPYDEAAWAELADTQTTPVEVSLALLDALHCRWVVLLRAMTEREYAKTLRHPEHGRTFTLDQMLAQYAWHSEHHLRHITSVIERERWSATPRDGCPVTIRRYQVEDAAAVWEAVCESRAELEPWMPWCHAAYSIQESRSWLEAQVAAFDQGTAFEFAIVGSNGEYLGGCGLNQIDQTNRHANLGYWVRTPATRRGVATKAVLAIREWADQHTDLIRLEMVIAVGNVASQQVAQRAGGCFEGTLRRRLLLHGVAHDAMIFSLIRDVT